MTETLSMQRIEAAWEEIQPKIDGVLDAISSLGLSDAEVTQLLIRFSAQSLAHVTGAMMAVDGEQIGPAPKHSMLLARVDQALEVVRQEIAFCSARKVSLTQGVDFGHG